MPERKHPKRICRSVRHRDQERVKPGEDWRPLNVPPNLIETIDAYLANDKPKVGWCLLCNSPIESEDDFIPQTNTHNCAEGLCFREGREEP